MTKKVVSLTERLKRNEAAATLAEMSLARAHALAGLVRSELGIITTITDDVGVGPNAPIDSLDLVHVEAELMNSLADLELLRRRLAAGEEGEK
jgi:hypothetical protein